MNRQWHQSAWQWLNHLEEIKKGVPCEHRDNQRTEATSDTKDVLDGEHRNRGTRTLGGGSMKTLTLVLCCVSLSWACPKGSSEWRDGVCAADIKPEGVSPDESKKWMSDEKAPGKGHQPAWETGEVKTENLQNTDVARRSPPDSCKGEHQVWTGAQCLGQEDPIAGKPSQVKTFTATATTTTKEAK